MLRSLLLAFALLATGLAAADEVAFTNRATELKDQGSPDARTVTSLREGTQVKVTQRAGGWARVDAGGQAGWVKVFHLRFPAVGEAGSSSGGALSGLTSLISGRSTTQRTTLATTGIRGLSPEDLKNANPDPEALKKMQGYRADKPAAERFAKEGKLAEASVASGGRP